MLAGVAVFLVSDIVLVCAATQRKLQSQAAAHRERHFREVPRPREDREHGKEPALPDRSHATPSEQVARAVARGYGVSSALRWSRSMGKKWVRREAVGVWESERRWGWRIVDERLGCGLQSPLWRLGVAVIVLRARLKRFRLNTARK